MTIAERLDKAFPAKCPICAIIIKRVSAQWPTCPRCGLDMISAEYYQIARYKLVADL